MPALRGPDGKIVYVTDDQVGRYTSGGYTPIGEDAAGEAASRIAPTDNGITGSIGATISSGLAGATLGASDWLLKGALNKGQFEQLRQDREDNPVLSGLGQTAGALVPALVTGGTATPTGYLSSLTADSVASAQAAGGAAGTVRALAAAGTEGAIQNAGAYLSDVALGDRDLTAQGMTGALGTGFAFGSGGLVAMHGIEAGTMAARRMFARYAAGGEEAAATAASEWQAKSQAAFEAFDQTADMARAKLAQAQLERQQADLARRQASASVAESKLGVPLSEADEAAAAGAVPGPAPSAPVGDGLPTGFPRDYMAERGLTPDQMKQAYLQREAGRADLTAGTRSGVEDALGVLSARNGIRSAITPEVEADLSSALNEYTAARKEFDELHAKIDPDLDAALRGLGDVEVQRPTVPVGEFGAPGAGGIKSPEQLAQAAHEAGADLGLGAASESPATAQIRKPARMPEGTPVEPRAQTDVGMPGGRSAPAPTTPFDFKESGLKFDPETRQYTAGEAKAEPLSDDEFASLASKWRAGLKPGAKQALEAYSRNGTFSLINGPLRSSGDLADVPEHLHGTVREIDKALETAPAPRDLVAYRGVSGRRSVAQWSEVKPGDSIVDPGFGSTSASPQIGGDYAKGLGVRSGVELRISVPKGYPAAPIPSEIFGSESELLLPRNTKYTVTSVEDAAGGGKIVHVTASAAGDGEASKVATAANKPVSIEEMNIRQLDEHMDRLEKRKNELDRPGTRDSDEFKQVKADIEATYDRHRAIKRGEVPEPKGVAKGSPSGWRADSGTPEPDMAPPYRGKYSAAGGVVFNGEGKIAITRPIGGGHGGEEWALPKGRIDPGETPSQAAMREVLEESGAHGEIHQHIGDYEGEHSNARFYAMRHTGDDLAAMAANGETAEVRFVTPDEAERMLTRPQERKVVADARRMLGDKGGEFWSGAHVRGGGSASPDSDLLAALQGTKSALDSGADLKAMGEPARAEYRTAKAAKTSAAAEHFRAKATAAKEGAFKPIGDDMYSAQREAYESRLSPDEKKALDTYTSSTYKDINRALRHGEIRNGREQFISKLDEAVAKSSLHDNAVMYRGLSGDEAKQFRNLEIGDAFEEKAFTSTSSSPTAFKRDVNLHIDVPAGYEAAPIPSKIDEKEWLLRRNTKFVVTGIEDQGATRTIKVRLEEAAPPRPLDEMVSNKTGRQPDAPPIEIVKARVTSPTVATPATEPQTDLERLLRGTKEQLGAGRGMREIAGAPAVSERVTAKPAAPSEPPSASKQLEMEHDAAIERVLAAKTPEAKAAAQTELRAVEQKITGGPARPGAVEDVAAMAPVVTRVERAAAKLTEALGEEAPAVAKEHAAALRSAEDAADAKSMARTARAADDHAAAKSAADAQDFLGPSKKQIAVAQAQKQRLSAEAAYQKARVAEAEASIGAKKASQAARDGRAKFVAENPPPAGAAAQGSSSGIGTRALAGAHAIGYAAELGSDLGIPGIPRPHDIPLIGPLLSAYLKYRAFKAAAGRFVGRVPATAEAHAAALAAKTRDNVARSVDQALGLVERNGTTIRRTVTIGAIRANEALSKRAFDDGQPDAGKGATVSQLAAVRMREVAAVATNPQLIIDKVRAETRGVMDPDLIQALENHLVATFQHLHDTAPKGPPPNPYTKKEWAPPAAAALQWGQRLAVANDPNVVFEMLQHGAVTPAAADTFQAVYDKLFAEAQQRLISRAADLKHPVEYRQLIQNALLFGVPLHDSLDPENASVLSTAHMPSAQTQPQVPAGPPIPGLAAPTQITSLYQTSADRRAGGIK